MHIIFIIFILFIRSRSCVIRLQRTFSMQFIAVQYITTMFLRSIYHLPVVQEYMYCAIHNYTVFLRSIFNVPVVQEYMYCAIHNYYVLEQHLPCTGSSGIYVQYCAIQGYCVLEEHLPCNGSSGIYVLCNTRLLCS